MGEWVGGQAMAEATTKCACLTRTTRLIGLPAGGEKTFFASFVPQPAKNYTSLSFSVTFFGIHFYLH
jgi:hypothetical protein